MENFDEIAEEDMFRNLGRRYKVRSASWNINAFQDLIDKIYQKYPHRLFEYPKLIFPNYLYYLIMKSYEDEKIDLLLKFFEFRPLLPEYVKIVITDMRPEILYQVLDKITDFHQELFIYEVLNSPKSKIVNILVRRKDFIFPIEVLQSSGYYQKIITEKNLRKIVKIFKYCPPLYKDCQLALQLKDQELDCIFLPYYKLYAPFRDEVKRIESEMQK